MYERRHVAVRDMGEKHCWYEAMERHLENYEVGHMCDVNPH